MRNERKGMLMKIEIGPEFWKAALDFLEFAWIPVAEVVGGIIIGPRVKKLIVKMADKSQDKGVMTFLGSTANILIIASAFIMAAEAVGIKMSSIVSLLSAVGLGISLALKGNMANVAGGIQILVTKPFVIGDYIKVSTHRGYVTTIELMFITIRTDNGKEVVIPNSTIISDIVTNYSKYDANRIKIKFQVPVGKDPKGIEEAAKEIMLHNEYILPDKPIKVTVSSIASGYVTYLAMGYVKIGTRERCKRSVLRELVNTLPVYLPSTTIPTKIEIVSDSNETNISVDQNNSTQTEEPALLDDGSELLLPVNDDESNSSSADPDSTSLPSVESVPTNTSAGSDVQSRTSAESEENPAHKASAADALNVFSPEKNAAESAPEKTGLKTQPAAEKADSLPGPSSK